MQSWGDNNDCKSSEPSIFNIKCHKVQEKYEIEFLSTSASASCGSPIINQEGQLVGLVSDGCDRNTEMAYSVQAKLLKKLYDEEVIN